MPAAEPGNPPIDQPDPNDPDPDQPQLGAHLRAVAAAHLPSHVAAPTRGIASALRAIGFTVVDGPIGELPTAGVGALALLDDELGRAGEHAEGLVAEAARVLRPGGLLLASAPNRVHALATGRALHGLRAYAAAELRRLLGHRGFAVEMLCAPGAASVLSGAGTHQAGAPLRYDPSLDPEPGLLDAAPQCVALARRALDERARSAAFFASLPRKVVASGVLCRDPAGRVLVVHDSYRGHWTIPGGVVDADEDPRAAAARETWEEAGVRVAIGDLLGVFAASWPDRVLFVYAAEPLEVTPAPAAVHTHEIDDAAWVELDDALARVAPMAADQLRRCLRSPGGTWRL